jgi:hypothetical protein
MFQKKTQKRWRRMRGGETAFLSTAMTTEFLAVAVTTVQSGKGG